MEVPWQNLFFDMEMEDGDFFNQHHHKNSFDDEELVLGEILQQSAFSSESDSHSPPTKNNGSSSLSFEDTTAGYFLNNKRGKILTKSNSSKSIVSQHAQEKPATATSPMTSCIPSFHDSTVVAAATREANNRKHQSNRDQVAGTGGTRSSKGTNLATRKGRSSSESLDHILAERKRRQELTERFIALSATIPGLKKIDKASILSEAITYVKQLEKRIIELENQSSKKIKVESVSFMNKAHFYNDKGSVSSCKTNSDDCQRLNVALPEVEARVLEKEVLIRIHCKKQNGVMLKLLTLLKSLDLSIVTNSVLPFGNSVLDITVVAQMSGKHNATVKDLVKSLRLTLLESPDVQQ